MKKALVIVTLLIMVVGLITGCGGGKSPGSQGANTVKVDYPTKPITILVPFSAGGATDLGARTLAPYLEKELGVPVVVDNRPGANGWICYTELLKAKPDGYTLAALQTPGLVMGELNPSVKRPSYESFDYIANHVIDTGVIAVKAEETRFTNIKELIEYAKTHDLTISANGVASSTHLAALSINEKFGVKLRPVQFAGASEALTAVLGGHVDILNVKVGEILQPMKDGQFKVLGVMTKERVPQLPNVPTFKETVGEVIGYSTRGIGAPKGLDPKVMEKLQLAVEKAMKNPEHIKKMEVMGLSVDGRKGEDYKKMVAEEENNLKNLVFLLGWKK